MKKKGLLVMLLLAASLPLFAQVNCYTNSRSQGLSLMQSGNYKEAIEQFQSAMSCPDKPANNDLQAKIDECKKLFRQQTEAKAAAQKRRKEEEARRIEESERRREAELASRGFMEVRDLEFANSVNGKFLGEPGDPLFENTTRNIHPILSYRGLARDPKTVVLGIKFIGPDGALVGGSPTPEGYSYTHTVTVSPKGGRLNIVGWGNKDKCIFSPGVHTCEIWCEGNKLTAGTFTIQENREASTAGLFYVTGVSLANTTFDNELLSGYGATLHSDDIRYMKAKVRYSSDRSRKVDLSIRILKPDGTDISDTDSYFINAGTGLELPLTGWGAKKMSIFSPGTYQYEIWFEGRKLYSQTFYVVESDWRVSMNRVMLDKSAEVYPEDNSKYRGSFADTGDIWNRNGLGVYTWPDGSYYWGNWSDGVCEGEGLYIAGATYTLRYCPGCTFYVGSFVNNQRSGWGACYDMDGNLVYEGNFSADAPTGTFPTPGQSNKRFQILKADGGYYVGETLDGRRHGKGVFISDTGEAWYGNWAGGAKQGEGLDLRRYSDQY